MISNSEQAISERLRAILADLPVGADIPQDESMRQIFLPDEIRWMECRLGSRGPHGMIRMPYDSFMSPIKESLRLYGMHGRCDKLDWMYQVAFGEREA